MEELMRDIFPDLRAYVESSIIPQYDTFDQAHQRDHVEMVIRQSLQLARKLDADINMAYAIAAFHDTGLCEGREHHHEVSAAIIRADQQLPHWFSAEQIETMTEAAEDHRASAARPPRSLYGRIVAEADRFIDPETIIRRTIQFGIDHYPQLSQEEHYQRTITHLREKYGRGGYLHLWFPDSPNAHRLEQLRQMIDAEYPVHQLFDSLFPLLSKFSR